MKIIPIPKHYVFKDGFFNMKKASILQSGSFDFLGELLGIQSSDNGNVIIDLTSDESEAYSLDITSDKIVITGSEKGVFYAVSTLRQLIHEYGDKIPCIQINDEPDFAVRGYYFDITRGRVPKLETLYKLCDTLAYYKLNHLELYVEHSFEYTGMEEIWYDKSPITREEIKALDAYCRKLYIELVPSFSLFGHLYEILRHPKYSHLCEITPESYYSWHDRMRHHTIDITNPESFELIKGMIDDVVDLFTSDKFNICCDETFDLGTGKSKEYVEKVGIGTAYTQFVKKIATYVQSKGKKVMLWGDIVLKHKECIPLLPKDLTMLNWNYNAEPSEENIKLFEDVNIPQIVCPGTLGWCEPFNNYPVAHSNIIKSAKYAKKHGAEGLLTTDWGDFGHFNIPENSLPMLVLAAGVSWNVDTDIPNSHISFMLDEDEDTLDTLMEISKFIRYNFRTMVMDYESIARGEVPQHLQRFKDYKKRDSCKIFEKALPHLPNYSLGIRGSILLHKIAYTISDNATNTQLAEEIRSYIAEYADNWRKDYKESELQKIIDFFYSLAAIVEGTKTFDYNNFKY